mmetsp:Transcript_8352/g.34974  ORF Transcript_8352/g.34974 Transcript_8352/m.34974 type:complete len:249 (-) Transcript_8352:775-1521(-)
MDAVVLESPLLLQVLLGHDVDARPTLFGGKRSGVCLGLLPPAQPRLGGWLRRHQLPLERVTELCLAGTGLTDDPDGVEGDGEVGMGRLEPVGHAESDGGAVELIIVREAEDDLQQPPALQWPEFAAGHAPGGEAGRLCAAVAMLHRRQHCGVEAAAVRAHAEVAVHEERRLARGDSEGVDEGGPAETPRRGGCRAAEGLGQLLEVVLDELVEKREIGVHLVVLLHLHAAAEERDGVLCAAHPADAAQC